METWSLKLERLPVQEDVETITTAGLINQMRKHDKNPSCSRSPASSNAEGAKCRRWFTSFCITTFNDGKVGGFLLWLSSPMRMKSNEDGAAAILMIREEAGAMRPLERALVVQIWGPELHPQHPPRKLSKSYLWSQHWGWGGWSAH